MNVHTLSDRLSTRHERCQHCGIRVPRNEMVYDRKACSDDCADEIWLKERDLAELNSGE